MRLEEGGWYPQNRATLEQQLGRWRDRVRAGERVVATFDFDNTSIFHDIGEAVMRYQLERMAFGMTTEELAALLPEEALGVRTLASGVALADVRLDLLESYEQLSSPSARAAAADPSPQQAAVQRDFAARMAWLYGALEDDARLGAGVAYPFLARWMGGFSADEVRALAADVVAHAAQERPGRLVWQSDEGGRSGPVRARFCTGLRALVEMRALMQALTDAGVLVFIITASQQELVEGAALALGYPVPREHIFGMRLEQDGARLLPRSVDIKRYPLTWRGGKREVIERFLPAPPVLACGDSDTDFEMLTSFEETELRLIINRDSTGQIRSLYDDERTLLQGRDEHRGCFHKERESVLFAAEEPSA